MQFSLLFLQFYCREYCALKNPISHLFIKSKNSVSLDLEKKMSYPNIVKLRLKLTLNEVFISL